jgi:hypothetical protein
VKCDALNLCKNKTKEDQKEKKSQLEEKLQVFWYLSMEELKMKLESFEPPLL